MTEPNDPLLEQLESMVENTGRLAQSLRRVRLWLRLTAVALAVALVAAGISIYAAVRSRGVADCTARWANAYTARVSIITQASTERQDASAAFNLAIADLAGTIAHNDAAAFQKSLATLQRASGAFTRANSAYKAAAAAHPLDRISEKLDC